MPSASKNARPAAPKEIRFTRNAQALHFFLLALFGFCLSTTLWLLSVDFWEIAEPLLSTPLYALLGVPFLAAGLFGGIHLVRHAYMIFSPVGIELFPFFFPGKNMEVIYWSEVDEIGLTADKKMVEITLSGEADRKVFVATAPLNARSKRLLEHTLEGIRQRRAGGSADAQPTADH